MCKRVDLPRYTYAGAWRVLACAPNVKLASWGMCKWPGVSWVGVSDQVQGSQWLLQETLRTAFGNRLGEWEGPKEERGSHEQRQERFDLRWKILQGVVARVQWYVICVKDAIFVATKATANLCLQRLLQQKVCTGLLREVVREVKTPEAASTYR